MRGLFSSSNRILIIIFVALICKTNLFGQKTKLTSYRDSLELVIKTPANRTPIKYSDISVSNCKGGCFEEVIYQRISGDSLSFHISDLFECSYKFWKASSNADTLFVNAVPDFDIVYNASKTKILDLNFICTECLCHKYIDIKLKTKEPFRYFKFNNSETIDLKHFLITRCSICGFTSRNDTEKHCAFCGNEFQH